MGKKDGLVKIFSRTTRNVLGRLDVDFEDVQEVRLRMLAPLLVVYKNIEYYLTHSGRLSGKAEDTYAVSREGVWETTEYISHYSLYAYKGGMKQGFITIQGGHRIGIAGRTIVDNKGICSMKYVSFINIRLSHQVKGCASAVLPYLHHGGDIFRTLVISPPRCGETTLLRDVIRQISNGIGKEPGMTVGVIDERPEIGACYQGVPQNKLSIRTDILDCCLKARGMMMLIRTISSRVIAVDEIGSREDLEAMEYVMNCGCKLIATVHGNSAEDIKQKPVLRKLVQERIFKRYIVLDSKGKIRHVAQIYDSRRTQLYHPEGCL